MKLIEAGSSVAPSLVTTGAIVYGAVRIGRSIERGLASLGQGLERHGALTKEGMMGFMSAQGSGADHMKAGQEKLGQTTAEVIPASKAK